MYCPKCGTETSENDSFCRRCGSPTSSGTHVTMAASPTKAQASPSPMEAHTRVARPTHWYYFIGDKQCGPVSESELLALIENGRVGLKTIARSADEGDWRGTQSIEILQKLYGLPPARRILPPLPSDCTLPQLAGRVWEEKIGKPFDEFTPREAHDFAQDAESAAGDWNLAIELLRGTGGEAILRRYQFKFQIHSALAVIGAIVGGSCGYFLTGIWWIGGIAAFLLFVLSGFGATRIVYPELYEDKKSQ